VATKTESGLDFESMSPKSSGSKYEVLEVLELVPGGIVGEGGRFRTVQALATRVFRDSQAARKANPDHPLLTVRSIDGEVRVCRIAG